MWACFSFITWSLSHFLAIFELHNWPLAGLDAAASGFIQAALSWDGLGGGGSLGWSLADVYTLVPTKKYFTLILKSLNSVIKCA